MGLDLTLLPIECDQDEWGYSHTVLNCERRSSLFEALLEIPAHPVPLKFHTYLSRDEKYEEPHYSDTQKTPYGDALQWVRVSDLMKFKNHEGVTDNTLNRAVWAYLGELKPEMKIALYWS